MLGTTTRGRPRDPELDRSILFATLEVLGEVGYDRLTIEGVAARSGVAKASIYRRWAGKPELILDAIRAIERSFETPPEDTGSLRGDLLVLLPRLTAFSAFGASQGPIVLGMAQAMRNDPKLVDHMHARFISDLRHASEIVVERAITRGEIPVDVRRMPLFHDIAPSLMTARMLLTFDPIDTAFHVELVDTILIPLLRISHS